VVEDGDHAIGDDEYQDDAEGYGTSDDEHQDDADVPAIDGDGYDGSDYAYADGMFIDEDAPIARGHGRILGRVIDRATGEPLIEAAVEVVETREEVRTDLDGRFMVDVRPGSFTLRSYYPLYRTERVSDVRVRRADVTEIEIGLAEQVDAVVEVVEVVARAESHTEAAQLLERSRSATVSDVISAQEMSRSAAGAASDAARRVTGASVVDGRYVYVRGLGDRYGSTLFNGVPLPSPEPDRRVVPLDIFPTSLLESFQVVKTGAPHLPGDFAGGLSQIATRRYPSAFTLQAGLSVGADTQTTFRELRLPDIAGLDFLAFDDGGRDTLAGLPPEQVFVGSRRTDGTPMTAEEVERYGEGLHNAFEPQLRRTWPNFGFNVSVGDSFTAGSDQTLGYSLSLTYGSRLSAQEEVQRAYALDEGALALLDDFSGTRTTHSVLWGALGNLAWRLAPGHEISLNAIYTRKADNTGQRLLGFDSDEVRPLRRDRIQYASRSLLLGQLQGDHRVDAMLSDLRWQANVSSTTRYEPDTRELMYQQGREETIWQFVPGTDSGSHFHSDMLEISAGGGFDWQVWLRRDDRRPASIQFGFLGQYRERDFAVRRFRFLQNRGANRDHFLLPPDELFTAAYIGPDLRLEESTRVDDTYDASQSQAAGYAMLDLSLWPGMRAVAGLRVEYSDQQVVTRNPYAAVGAEPTRAGVESVDFLPSVNLVQEVAAGMNLRLAVAQTVARPEFREMTPFAYYDFVGAQVVYGNPDLRGTRILNADLRWEWFPSPGEVLAASAFYKSLEAPIESVVVPTSERARSYRNAVGAWVVGAELEARASFGFIHEALAGLQIVANFTYVHSRIDLDEREIGIQTTNERPLQGQSPYVVNLGLDYKNDDWGTRLRLMYNVLGERIDQVGAAGLPDVYEQPRHLLDLVAEQELDLGFSLKFTAQNLLDQAVELTQAGNVVTRFRPGVSLSLGLSWAY
jgi:hypothetical protein